MEWEAMAAWRKRSRDRRAVMVAIAGEVREKMRIPEEEGGGVIWSIQS